MIELQDRHPYEAITQFIFGWIACLVRGDYDAADRMVDAFEGPARIGDYFAIEDEEGPMQAVDPAEGGWWQLSCLPTEAEDQGVLVEAYVPLARGYRALNACFVFVPSGD